MLRNIAIALMATASLASCENESSGPSDAATFVVQVEDEQFRVRIENQATIAQARALIASGQHKIVNGVIARGSGGFNTGYSWHLRPNTIEFADLTMELCDGMPSYVEENVDYYVDSVKRYCPWGTRIISEVGTQQ